MFSSTWTLTRQAVTMAKPSAFAARRWLSTPSSTGPAFCFDIDGVLKQGEKVLPQALEVMQILTGKNPRKRKYPFILVTNGGGTFELDRSTKLSRELQTPIALHQIVQSHTIFRSLVPRFGDKPVLVVGGKQDNCRLVAERYGFKRAYIPADILAWEPSIWPFHAVTEQEKGYLKQEDFSQIEFAAVLVFADSRDWGRDIQLIMDVLQAQNGVLGTRKDAHDVESWKAEKQVPLFFSNPDVLWGNEFPVSRFGQGVLQESLAAVYKLTTGYEMQRTTGGKPTRATYDYASNLLNLATSHPQDSTEALDMNAKATTTFSGNVWMVGDNQFSDIQGANDFGWSSMLVRTGVFKGDESELVHKPTIIVDDVLEGVKQALRMEGEEI